MYFTVYAFYHIMMYIDWYITSMLHVIRFSAMHILLYVYSEQHNQLYTIRSVVLLCDNHFTQIRYEHRVVIYMGGHTYQSTVFVRAVSSTLWNLILIQLNIDVIIKSVHFQTCTSCVFIGDICVGSINNIRYGKDLNMFQSLEKKLTSLW